MTETKPASPPSIQAPRPRLAAVIAAAFVALTILWFALGRAVGVPDEWTIKPQVEAWPLLSWWQPLGVLLILGGLAAWSAYDRFRRARTRKEQNASTTLCVVALTVLCAVWPWALMGPIGPITLISSAWSDVSNEYFGTSYQVENARQFSSEYAARWQQPQSAMKAHVATHPPGTVLLYYGARRLFEASPTLQSAFHALAIELVGQAPTPGAQRTLTEATAHVNEIRGTAARSAGIQEAPAPLPDSAVAAALWCQFLIALILAAAVPAVYLLASTTGFLAASTGNTPAAGGPDAAWPEARGIFAASLFVLAPCTGLFAFTVDSVIAAGAIWTLALAGLRLRGGRPVWMVAAGAVLGLTSFISFGAMATGVIVVLSSLLWHSCSAEFAPAQIPRIARNVVIDVLLLGAGFVATWLLLSVLFPMQPLTIFRNAMAAHRYATLGTRTYWKWAPMNLLLFAVFCGWPVILQALGRVWQVIRTRRAGTVANLDTVAEPAFLRPAIATVVGCATLLTMLLLTFSSSVRGETERLWFFLLPPLCALAASNLGVSGGLATRQQVTNWSLILAIQVAQTLFMAALLSPLVRPL